MHRERTSGGSSSRHQHGDTTESASSTGSNSCVPLVVAPVLARMLGVHQDKQVQKALAQLKLAFDNLERLRPAISRDVITQMFELVVSSKNPNVSSLMPPSVAALASLTSELSLQHSTAASADYSTTPACGATPPRQAMGRNEQQPTR